MTLNEISQAIEQQSRAVILAKMSVVRGLNRDMADATPHERVGIAVEISELESWMDGYHEAMKFVEYLRANLTDV